MKKTALLFLLLTFFALQGAFAQVDCGAVDCPGRCGRFIDANGDGFCDHGSVSKPAQPEKVATETTKPQPPAAKPAPEPSDRPGHHPGEFDGHHGHEGGPGHEGHHGPCPGECEHHGHHGGPGCPPPPPGFDKGNGPEMPAPAPKKGGAKYPVFPILGGLFALYIISLLLVKFDVWKKATHRKVWNIALLLTCLFSCIMGVILAIFINYGYYPQGYVDFLHWHVYVGIGMTIIAIFHAIWHFNYYKAIFTSKKEKEND